MYRLIIITFFVLLTTLVHADWQATLESNFDIVDTFNDLEDWQGVDSYHNINNADMPKKIGGADSIWDTYSNDTDAKDDWIQDHGSSYRWTTGNASNATFQKSACINYLFKVSDTWAAYDGYGPSRLGALLGDGITGKSGYPSIYVFYMLKFHPGFFPLKDGETNEFEYEEVLKFIDITSGFTAPNKWGTDADIAEINPAETETNFNEYGMNGTLLNITGGGDSTPTWLHLKDGSFVLEYTDPWWEVTGWYSQDWLTSGTSYETHPDTYLNLADSYLSGEWVGLEIHLDRGTVGSSNGTLEVWLYNESGDLIGHNNSQVDTTKMIHSDHYYNMVTFGGNRLSTQEVTREENRFYIDDVVIHDSRIAPTYFSLLNSSETPNIQGVSFSEGIDFH